MSTLADVLIGESPVIGWEFSRHLLVQSDTKLKPIVTAIKLLDFKSAFFCILFPIDVCGFTGSSFLSPSGMIKNKWT